MKVVNTIMDSFFVDYCVEHHWSIPVKWFVIGSTPSNQRKDVEYSQPDAAIDPTSSLYQSIMEADVWVIHRYYKEFANLILGARQHGVRVYIQTWGPDLLQFDTSHTELHDAATLRMVKKHNLVPSGNSLQKAYRRYYWNRKNALHRKAFSEASGIMFITPPEDVPFKATIRHLGEYRFVLNDEMPERGPRQSRERVVLGHCAWTTMNHFDAIERLAPISEALKEVLIPMTYGANDDYKDAITAYAETKLKCPIVTLRKMLPRSEFDSVISAYGTFLHHANRQQAIVNVMNFIYREGELILKPNKPVAQFLEFLEIPYHINSQSFIDSPISATQRKKSKENFHSFTCSRNRLTEELILNDF